MKKLNLDSHGSAIYAAIAALFLAQAAPPGHTFDPERRTLSLYHTHTQEMLTVTFAESGEYNIEALADINKFLADFRTGDIAEIDPALLDLIYDVRLSLGSKDVYEVISAYRSPATNEMLRDKSSGVAKNSQHLLGKAIDVRLRGVDTVELRDAAIAIQRGGVGFYESSDFVHMDTGRVRRW